MTVGYANLDKRNSLRPDYDCLQHPEVTPTVSKTDSMNNIERLTDEKNNKDVEGPVYFQTVPDEYAPVNKNKSYKASQNDVYESV